jgi:hypothetical protein
VYFPLRRGSVPTEVFHRAVVGAADALDGVSRAELNQVLWRREPLGVASDAVRPAWDAFLQVTAEDGAVEGLRLEVDGEAVAESDRWIMASQVERDERAGTGRSLLKTMTTSRRTKPISREDYVADIRANHVALALAHEVRFCRYVTSVAVGECPWDWMSELWYPSPTARCRCRRTWRRSLR